MCGEVPYNKINAEVMLKKFFLFLNLSAAAKSLQSCLTLRPHRWQPTKP